MEDYYVQYLRNIRNLKESSVKHYLDAIKYISGFLAERDKITESLYEVHDLGELEIIREYIKQDSEFVALDKRGHQMYSAGLNNYYRFASGENFAGLDKKIELLDMEVTPEQSHASRVYQYWKRSSIVKIQAVEYAGYQCEIDVCHKTFTSKSTGHQYMEAHHAIPMMQQEKFANSSLDVYANVVCLCPVCHRLIHYGVENEKQHLIDQIYSERADRLANCGVKVSKDEFIKLIG